MARQLADEELARLIVLDTIALGDGPRAMVAESDLITWFFGELLLEAHGMKAAELTLAPNGTDRDDVVRFDPPPRDRGGNRSRREFATVDPTALRDIPRQLRRNAELSPRTVGS